MTWTDDRLALLKNRWNAGRSCTEIAEELGGGISRNAVIGKVHRLGLMRVVTAATPRRAPAAAASPRVAVAKPVVNKPIVPLRPKAVLVLPQTFAKGPRVQPTVEPVAAGAPAPGSRMLAIFDLSLIDHCKYVYGDPRDFESVRYCAADVEPGTSWCPHHRAACGAGFAGRMRLPGEPRTEAQERQSAAMRAYHERRQRETAKVSLGGRR